MVKDCLKTRIWDREQKIGMHFSLLEDQLVKEGLKTVFERPIVLLKTLHTDFVVRELSPFYKNGTPLVLEPLPTVEVKCDDEVRTAKRKREEMNAESTEAFVQEKEQLEVLLARVQHDFASLITDEELESLTTALRTGMQSFVLRGVMTKAQRTLVHEAVKKSLGSTYISRTEPDGIIIEKATSAMRREAKRRSNPICTRKFLHFTLYKENIDSNHAMRALAAGLGIPTRQLLFSGTKDKRAVTLQRVAVRGLSSERLYAINKRSFGSSCKVKVCGFKEMDTGLRLGDTLGNHFLIILRLPSGGPGISSEMLHSIQKVISRTGVVNYYGPQRFGTSEVLTSDVGLHLLAGDFEQALRLIFLSKAFTIPSFVAVSEAFKRRDFNEALQLLPRSCFQERDILNHLVRFPNDFLGAFYKIPRTLGMLYCHAVQSLVWNVMASKRLAQHREPIVGDLVLKSRYVSVQGSEIRSTDDEENENCMVDMCSPKSEGLPEVVQLTTEDVAKGVFRLTDILLTVPGTDEELQYPGNICSRSAYIAALSSMGAEGLMKESNALVKVFHFHGAYRPLVVKPKRLDMRLVHTAGPRAQIIPTDLELLTEDSPAAATTQEGNDTPCDEGTLSSPCQAILVEFSLPPGSYATCVLREFSVCCVEGYLDAVIPNSESSQSLDDDLDVME